MLSQRDEPRKSYNTVQKPYAITAHDASCTTYYDEKCHVEYEAKIDYVDREECHTEYAREHRD